jgi:hypothetical protein
MFPRAFHVFVVLTLFSLSPAVRAGMPSPVPSDPERVYRLNETPQQRLQTISFFAAAFLVCAAVVQLLWNYIRRDFPSLPRLTLGRSLAAVFLWGVLFVLVLTMISGARELMTPGAWKKQGFVYKLNEDAPPPAAEVSPAVARRQALERLRTALLQYAAAHKGHFPEKKDLPADVWDIPDSYGMKFLYVEGLTADQTPTLLAYEPEIQFGSRLVLHTSGDITTADSEQIKELLKKEHRP